MYLLSISRPAGKRTTFAVLAPSGEVVYKSYKKADAQAKQKELNAPPVKIAA
jgi:hypothetical protein